MKDQTRKSWPRAVGEMAERVRELDWAETGLGPTDGWPESLRVIVETVLSSGFAMVALFGPELIQIYNDGFRDLMGEKHPGGLGQPTEQCWPEAWHLNEPIYRRVQSGETVTLQDARYSLARRGMVEDAWFTMSFSPLRDGASAISGVLVTVIETTERLRTEAGKERDLRESESKFRTVFESMDGAFLLMDLIFDPGGRAVDYLIVEHNSALERQSGVKGMAGKRARELDPHIEASWLEALGRVALHGESQRFERYDKLTARWYDVHASRVGGESSRRVAAVVNDVTTRKQAELSLRNSEERQAFLVRLGDALRAQSDPLQIQGEGARLLGQRLGVSRALYFDVEHGADSDYYVVNRDYHAPGFPGMIGRFRADEFGATLFDALRAGRMLVVADVATEPLLTEDERRSQPVTGTRAYVAVPLVKEGCYVAVFVVHQATPREWTNEEITLIEETAERTWAATERARAERQREALLRAATAARAEAEVANKAKDEFLATLSHELRTPLAAILLWGGALRSGALPMSELRSALDAIVQSAESQSRLIEDLLDLSRSTSRKLLLSRRSVSIGDVAQAALQVIRPTADARGILLELLLEDDVGNAVLDPIRLQQVLWNLLSNAVKFTEKGGTVTLSIRKHAGNLEADVADNGEGIAPEFMPHLFERFRQADMGQTREHAGLGIGLALSRQLVELHGGTIEAHSRGKGDGALFCVRIPLIEADVASPLTPAAAVAPSEARLEGLTVLLVEDDVNTRDAMQSSLARAGAGVIAVSSGAEALAVLDDSELRGETSAPPDVIVSDLRLPGMSGYALIDEIARRCRARGQRLMPACAVSADARDVDRQRAIDAGFDVYLAKPVTVERLIEAVEDLRAVAATSDA